MRLHRTTDPPRAHLWATFLCEQKGGSAGGSPAKRLTSLAKSNKSASGAERDDGDDQTGGFGWRSRLSAKLLTMIAPSNSTAQSNQLFHGNGGAGFA